MQAGSGQPRMWVVFDTVVLHQHQRLRLASTDSCATIEVKRVAVVVRRCCVLRDAGKDPEARQTGCR